MRECSLPETAAPDPSRTLTACIAAILEVEVATVPCPIDGSPWPQLSWWLATRNLALVPVREPRTFQWGGWWIARRAPSADPGGVHVLMAGTPSAVVWEPLGPVPAGDAIRRSVVTRGLDLNSLPGLRFRIGEVECFAQRLAEPCAWLQRTTPAGTLRGLVHRGGLRADILTTGAIAVGDSIRIDAEDQLRTGPPTRTPR